MCNPGHILTGFFNFIFTYIHNDGEKRQKLASVCMPICKVSLSSSNVGDAFALNLS